MFSNLRPNSTLYVLDKENLTFKKGQIESVVTSQLKLSNYPLNLQNTPLDIKVRIDSGTLEFQNVPSTSTLASFGDIDICDNLDEMFANIKKFMQHCQQTIEKRDYYEKAAAFCDETLSDLNRDYAKNKERDNAITAMKSEMSEIRDEFRGAVSEIKSLISLYMPKNGNSNK